jgi:hypothetical protein
MIATILKRSGTMEDEIAKVNLKEFEKKPDGSWVCVQNSDITMKTGRIIRVPPGTVFKKGTKFVGVDMAEALDKVPAN